MFTTSGEVAYSESSSGSSGEEDENVQLPTDDVPGLTAQRFPAKPDDDPGCKGEYFRPEDDDQDEGYKRVTPAYFDEDSGDIFMRSMIQNYALEEKNKDCTPSGKFWMNYEIARAAAQESL